MQWLQLHIDVSAEQTALLELLFADLGALSITLGDAGDETILEPAPEDLPLWRHTRVTALFDGVSDPDELRARIKKSLSPEIGERVAFDRLQDQVWERLWLKDFQPLVFGNRLWICPRGQRPQAPEAICIDLDPGLAFGTGTHPTTAMCLSWLDAAELKGKTVLDYGCGSGILAVAALRLGATSAIATDRDPLALEATQANAEKNNVADRLQVYPSDQLPPGTADIVLANIISETLIALRDIFSERTKTGGRVILSGILKQQAQRVSDHYAYNFQLSPPVELDDWVMLEGYKHSHE